MSPQTESAQEPGSKAKGLTACEPYLRPLIVARNASGIRRLAEQYEVPREELAAFLRAVLEEELAGGNEERLGPRFDIHTSEYSTLEEWATSFLNSL